MIAAHLITSGQPPAWIASLEARLLARACRRAAKGAGVRLPDISAGNPLERFKNLTMTLSEAAAAQPSCAQRLKQELGVQACILGSRARRFLLADDGDAFALLRFLYQGIGIDISGDLPGELCFSRCYFSAFYDPRTCDLMSAMDEGIMRGIAGEGVLTFTARITEGCPNCTACFAERNSHD